MLTFRELRRANIERCEGPAFKHRVFDWSPTDWACALAGEVGEACNLIKKLRRGEPVPIPSIAAELADVQAYLDLLAARLGIDLGAATIDKFNAVSDRRGSTVKLHEGETNGSYGTRYPVAGDPGAGRHESGGDR